MSTTNALDTRGRGWAYAGAILGGGISIAANVAHSFVPPATAPDTWAPNPGAVIGSVFWPVLLFFAVEILARVRWPQGLWWGLMRFGGMLPVASAAGLVSYRHLSSLLTFYGEDTVVSIAGPLAVDGLMVMATSALLVIGRRTRITEPPTQLVTPATPVPGHSAHTPATAHRDEPTVTFPAHLIPAARFAAASHARTSGRDITADELAAAINIPPGDARQLLHTVTDPAPVINGAVVGGAR